MEQDVSVALEYACYAIMAIVISHAKMRLTKSIPSSGEVTRV